MLFLDKVYHTAQSIHNSIVIYNNSTFTATNKKSVDLLVKPIMILAIDFQHKSDNPCKATP
jgi:hypothetical protein